MTANASLFITRMYLDHRSWRGPYRVRLPSVVCAVVARCKLPFALRPGLSQEDEMAPKKSHRKERKERTKEREK